MGYTKKVQGLYQQNCANYGTFLDRIEKNIDLISGEKFDFERDCPEFMKQRRQETRYEALQDPEYIREMLEYCGEFLNTILPLGNSDFDKHFGCLVMDLRMYE